MTPEEMRDVAQDARNVEMAEALGFVSIAGDRINEAMVKIHSVWDSGQGTSHADRAQTVLNVLQTALSLTDELIAYLKVADQATEEVIEALQ